MFGEKPQEIWKKSSFEQALRGMAASGNHPSQRSFIVGGYAAYNKKILSLLSINIC